ncbi:unnamed protein product [Cercospora beticola]|nr:unnamed protein product [Cercospora beticola]
MAPKTNCNAQKLNTIQTWLRKSRSVWSIKELEKQLPSVGSINGMQVKDYVQALQDESKISCEKIGSGNWYWAFQSERAKNSENKLATAQAEFEKIAASVEDFKQKLDARAEEIQKEMDADEGESREELTSRTKELETDVSGLKKQLEAFSGNDDPTMLEQMQKETCADYALAEMITEDVYAMESWFKKQGAEDMVATFPETVYGGEYDWEEATLIAHDPLESWFYD